MAKLRHLGKTFGRFISKTTQNQSLDRSTDLFLPKGQEIKWTDDWCEPVGDYPPITKQDLETKEAQCHSTTLPNDL